MISFSLVCVFFCVFVPGHQKKIENTGHLNFDIDSRVGDDTDAKVRVFDVNF